MNASCGSALLVVAKTISSLFFRTQQQRKRSPAQIHCGTIYGLQTPREVRGTTSSVFKCRVESEVGLELKGKPHTHLSIYRFWNTDLVCVGVWGSLHHNSHLWINKLCQSPVLLELSLRLIIVSFLIKQLKGEDKISLVKIMQWNLTNAMSSVNAISCVKRC